MPCYEYEGVRPVVHPSAFVHETAVLIGDVIIGEGWSAITLDFNGRSSQPIGNWQGRLTVLLNLPALLWSKSSRASS